MKSLRLKAVKLLCILATIAAPVSSFAQNYKITVKDHGEIEETLEQWRRQAAQSAQAQKQGLFVKKVPQSSGQTSLGGPGLDGGGGVGVLNSQGQLQLLDLALARGEKLVRFDNDSFRSIMASRGNFVTDQGAVVSNEEFFACAAQKFQSQDNLLLKFLKPENLKLLVLFTDLPLDRNSLSLSKVFFPSPAGTGYAYQAVQQPAANLYSPSVATEFQKPIASYGVQNVTFVDLPRQVLIVSSQMYRALSAQDRCALQVHEVLRYVDNFGKLWPDGVPFLTNRRLRTAEIENLTRKILLNQPVYVGEIPANNFYKALAVNGSDVFSEGMLGQISDRIFLEAEENPDVSSGEIASLYRSLLITADSTTDFESVVMDMSRNYVRLRGNLKQQEDKLKGKRFNLRELIP